MQKRTIIKRIKTIIQNHGSFSVGEIGAESSPIVESFGSTFVLAESFDINNATLVTYVNDSEVDENYVVYHELSKEVLEEILFLAEMFETDQEKTLKRISN